MRGLVWQNMREDLHCQISDHQTVVSRWRRNAMRLTLVNFARENADSEARAYRVSEDLMARY